MNYIEVMKQALEALEETTALCTNYESVEEPDGYQFTEAKTVIPEANKAITNLRAAIEAAEKCEPVGFIDAEQLRRWNVLRGTYYEAEERCYMPFSSTPFQSDMTDCTLPVYTHPAPTAPEGWLQAIDCELVCTHLGIAEATDTYEEARRKLRMLIDWHIAVATDPAVNGGWKLVPIEPTFEMIRAGSPETEGHYALPVSLYKAMLAAAPEVK